MIDSKIEWTDDTVNPWWGCQRVSRACVNCYAESLDARWHPGDEHWGPTASRLLRVEKAIAELERIARRGDKEGRPRRVFIASMSDFFEDRADLVEPRLRVWEALFRLDGKLIPMLLTKRPEVMAAWAKERGWPPGAWAMTTTEDRATFRERSTHLLNVPAKVRGISCEPLVEAIHVPLHMLGVGRWVECFHEEYGPGMELFALTQGQLTEANLLLGLYTGGKAGTVPEGWHAVNAASGRFTALHRRTGTLLDAFVRVEPDGAWKGCGRVGSGIDVEHLVPRPLSVAIAEAEAWLASRGADK